MRALVIAPQPFFTPRGTPFSVYYRTLVTSELGIEVDLLTYGEGQDVDLPGVRIIRAPRFSALGHVKTGPSVLKLFLDVFVFLRTIGLLLTNRYDFVHAHEEAIFFCRFLKPLFRFKLVYDMHSSLPQQLTNFNFTESKLLVSLFKWLEASCVHTSEAVITICPALADYVDRVIVDKDKHQLIENSIFEPVRLSQPGDTGDGDFESMHLSDLPDGAPLVVYAGTLEHYQGIDLMLEGSAIARKQNPELHLVIAGGTPEQVNHYRTRAGTLGLSEHCILTGRVPQIDAKALMARATALASPRTQGNNTPLKIYELLASGKPIIATDIFSHTQVLSNEVCFLVPATAEGLAQGILDATVDGPESQCRVANAARLYEEKYSRRIYESKMRTLLERLGCAV